jgi:putative sterol carrier protein
MREVMPWSLAVFVPPNWDLRYTEAYGFTLEDIFAFGMRSVEAKWRAAGFPLEEMPPGAFPLDFTKTPEERARQAITLLRAGVVGEPTDRVDSSPEVQELYFQTVARSARTESTDGKPFTVQWRFDDANPWHLVVDNGSTRVESGEAAHADVTLESNWRDLIAVSTGELRPGRALLGRRMRVHGRPLSLLRFRRLFPGSRTRA